MDDGAEASREWLTRLSALDWVRTGLAEVTTCSSSHDPRAMVAGCKRAAGMALNGFLRLEYRDSWGRSYVEHLRAEHDLLYALDSRFLVKMTDAFQDASAGYFVMDVCTGGELFEHLSSQPTVRFPSAPAR